MPNLRLTDRDPHAGRRGQDPRPIHELSNVARPQSAAKDPKVTLSPGLKILIALAIIIPAIIIWAKMGPMAAMSKLDARTIRSTAPSATR